MLAERVEDARDVRILVGYTVMDLDQRTFARYRQNYKSLNPDHIWNSEPDQEFLRLIGGWRRDRQSSEEGVTAAGMLMFGKLTEIQENFPYFMLDYQERAEAKTEGRWIDRVTLDGTWSGNLFDFYQLTMQRLARDLKIPFQLRGDTRINDTPVHEALREALVNTLIHADYSGRVSVLVVKRPDLFGFRNPGTMRMPADTAMRGGVSDCRNRLLQGMFRYVNLGEQAGSGLPRVYAAWRSQHWRAPELFDVTSPYEQTVFTLRMASLLPEETVSELEQRLGDSFRYATEVQKLALVTVALENKVTNARLRDMSDAHPRDITLALTSLVHKGLLETGGSHKQTYYYFPGEPPTASPDEVDRSSVLEDRLALQPRAGSLQHDAGSLQHDAGSLQHNAGSLQHDAGSLQHDAGSLQHSEELERLAQPFRKSKRIRRAAAESSLLALCEGRYLSLVQLSALTGRTQDTLRNHYLIRLVAEGKLRLRYPERPTHPAQEYTKA